MKFDTVKSVLLLASVGAVGYVAWRSYRGGADALGAVGNTLSGAASTVGSWVNPVADTNLAYRGVNAVGGAIAGPTGAGSNADGSWTLGGWLFDVTNPTIAAKRDAVAGGGVYNSTLFNNAAINDARQIDRIIERQTADYAALDARYAGAPYGGDGYTGTW